MESTNKLLPKLSQLKLKKKRTQPRVDILILNWNKAPMTIKCLRALENDNYANKKIIVVDNASSDDSVEVIRRAYPQIEIIINKKNYGFAKGFNLGIKKSVENGADSVLILSNDVFVKKNFLKPLVKQLYSKKKIGMVGPKVFLPDGTLDAVGAMIDFSTGVCPGVGHGKIDHGQFNKATKAESLAGSCMLVKTKVLRKIGHYIPEDYFFYYEETDLCLSIKKAGFELWVEPKSKVVHVHGGSSNPNLSSFARYYLARNCFHFVNKYAPVDKKIKFFITTTFKNFALIVKNLFSAFFKEKDKEMKKRKISWAKAYFYAELDFLRGRMKKREYPWLTI